MLFFRYKVAWHWDLHVIAFGVDLRVYFHEFFCSCLCFGLTIIYCVFLLIERLSVWIRVADFGIIDERDVLYSPSNQISR